MLTLIIHQVTRVQCALLVINYGLYFPFKHFEEVWKGMLCGLGYVVSKIGDLFMPEMGKSSRPWGSVNLLCERPSAIVEEKLSFVQGIILSVQSASTKHWSLQDDGLFVKLKYNLKHFNNYFYPANLKQTQIILGIIIW